MYPILLYIWNNSPPVTLTTKAAASHVPPSNTVLLAICQGRMFVAHARYQGEGCSVHNIVNQSSDTRHLEMESV